jgi:hypothetical protein
MVFAGVFVNRACFICDMHVLQDANCWCVKVAWESIRGVWQFTHYCSSINIISLIQILIFLQIKPAFQAIAEVTDVCQVFVLCHMHVLQDGNFW